jgi:hypothetical protein
MLCGGADVFAQELPGSGMVSDPDNAAQLGPQLAVETSKTAVLDAEQVTSIANAVGMSHKLVRGVARAPNRAIASGTHRLRPPTTG